MLAALFSLSGCGTATVQRYQGGAPLASVLQSLDAKGDTRLFSLHRRFVTPRTLIADPLPDTVGRLAQRLAPTGVQVDMSALGRHVNAPVRYPRELRSRL